MAGEFNAAQAQLGLAGQGGSFNPLGIPTPAPPPPPPVKSPGEISQEVTLHTTSAAANTINMAMTTRPMNMGMGNMGGGALGAFAQQYQANMASIQAAQMPAYSAQALGMMGGFGGGFNMGMMPNPAQMTSPGMGIYRPPPPMATPTVSPFPTMPMLPHPFTPNLPAPRFQTPMEYGFNASTQAGISNTAMALATPGVAARGAMDVGLAFGGQALGASLGARFGAGGAAVGRVAGLAAGAFLGEGMGVGAAAQHIVDRMNPFRGPAARTQQLLGASQDFVTGGPDLSSYGRGLTTSGAARLGTMLTNTARDTTFQRETGNSFSTQDMIRLTQESGKLGMLEDTQSVEQIHRRVKTLAKSLSGFMKIAGEPDVMNALKTMANLKAMGLSISETMETAGEARMYSKMAGTTVQGIMDRGGAPGAMLFQQQGLSAGLGFRVGMGAMGMAQASVGAGAFTPQRLAMLGGVSGIAQHEMESSAAFLKQPVLAAAMSRMGAGGEFGVSGSAIQGLLRGKTDINQMTGQAANNLLDAVQRGGVGALGMYQIQQSELQDQIGRVLGPQGLQTAKANQVMQTMKMLGLGKDAGGFATAALGMGMTNEQTRTLMTQMASPEYHENIQRQLQAQHSEASAMEYERRKTEKPDIGRKMAGATGMLSPLSGLRRGYKDIGEGFDALSEAASSIFFESDQSRRARERGQVHVEQSAALALSATEKEATRDITVDRGLEAANRRLRGDPSLREARGVSENLKAGKRFLDKTLFGGDADVLSQYRDVMGTRDSTLYSMIGQGGGLGERIMRGLSLGTLGATPDEMEQKLQKVGEAGAVMNRGLNLSAEERTKTEADLGNRFKTGGAGLGVAVAQSIAKASKDLGLKGYVRGDEKMDIDQMRAAARSADPSLAGASNAEIDKAISASAKEAKFLGVEGALSPVSTYNTRLEKEFSGDITRAKQAVMAEAFGGGATSADTKKGSAREKVFNRLFMQEKNEMVGVYATALAAQRKHPDDPKLAQAVRDLANKIPAEERNKAVAAATQIEKDGNIDLAAEIGVKQLADSGGDATKMIASAAERREAAVGFTEMDRRKKGLEAAGIKSEKYINKDMTIQDSESILKDLAAGTDEISDVKIKELVEAYRTANASEKKALEKELDSYISKRGVQGDSDKGGAIGAFTKAFESLTGSQAETASEMSKVFPKSVASFSQATQDFADAVAMLKGEDRPYKENVVE